MIVWIGFFFNPTLIAGSTQATRFTAARQIGDIAKSHPQDLSSLLKKVLLISTIVSLQSHYAYSETLSSCISVALKMKSMCLFSLLISNSYASYEDFEVSIIMT